MPSATNEDRLRDALNELIEACAYVSPIAGAVATTPSVKDIRNAGRFIAAVEAAKKIVADIESTGPPAAAKGGFLLPLR
jgi:hypothetical protein